MKKIEILECTLRDGSYSIDFQFTPRDTAIIATALENVGFDLIEIGHGVGLNASATGRGMAAAADKDYMKAAADSLKRAQWGMFFIPGIARHEDLDMAADYGMGFVRVGTNANEVEQSEAFIAHAKRLGMNVSANLMKSYIYHPSELASKAKLSEEFGVDLVCLVDSAGTMLPDDVRHYILEMKAVLSVPIGLHCHDNLRLGIANCMAAIEAGVERIDSTLQGMGRGGGNPATEILLTVLKKKGLDMGIDVNHVMDISQRLIRPLLREKGVDAIDITSGYAGFHSSYLTTILKYADRFAIDPRNLIVEVCRENRVEASEDLVQEIAGRIHRREQGAAALQMVSLPRISFSEERKEAEELSLRQAVQQIAKSAASTAKKKAKLSVLNIVASPTANERVMVSRFIQEDFGFVIASVELDSFKYMADIIEVTDGIVDIFLIDAELKEYQEKPLVTMARDLGRKSRVFGYRDSDVWVRAVDQEIGCLVKELCGCSILITGTDRLSLDLAVVLAQQGAIISLLRQEGESQSGRNNRLSAYSCRQLSFTIKKQAVAAARDAQIVISFARDGSQVTAGMVEVMAKDGIVFDAGIGGVSPEAISFCNQKGIRVVRPDMRAALASELTSLLGSNRIVNELMGRKQIVGVSVVAGGLVGNHGEVVVDSVSNPSKVVGVADGRGFLIDERKLCNEDRSKIQQVEQAIAEDLMS